MWRRLRIIVLNLLDVGETEVSDWEMIYLRLPNNRSSNEVIWLISSYVGEVWSSLYVKGVPELNDAQFFGFLKFKYKNDQLGARLPLNQIPGLG